MDLNTITVADFKAQFFRDFPYLPVYSNTKLYNQGAHVYYPTTELFYDCKANGTIGVLPTDVTAWDIVADDVMNYVQDADIIKAFAEAQVVFNQALFGSDDEIRLVYLYVVAHYLCIDLNAAAAGIGGTGGIGILSGRTVGSVSESYQIPKTYLDNPTYAIYAKTNYGLKYLSLVLPKLVGNIVAVRGMTLP